MSIPNNFPAFPTIGKVGQQDFTGTGITFVDYAAIQLIANILTNRCKRRCALEIENAIDTCVIKCSYNVAELLLQERIRRNV